MADVENYKIEYFSDGEDASNKMLKYGKPVKRIKFVNNAIKYGIEYNSIKNNYEMREDGLVIAEFAFKNGKLHGKFCRYEMFPCGISGADYCPEIVEEGHYINGKKVGKWHFYEYSPTAWVNNEKPKCTSKVFCGDEDVTHLFDNPDCRMLRLQMLKKSQNRR